MPTWGQPPAGAAARREGDKDIKESLNKANKTIAWVSRNIICKSTEVMALIYRSLVRPHLEYAVQCWSPAPRHGNWGTILDIEKVQRKYTRLINDIGTHSYGDRLESLKLTTLTERRMRGDLIETFKIVRGFVTGARTPNDRCPSNDRFSFKVI